LPKATELNVSWREIEALPLRGVVSLAGICDLKAMKDLEMIALLHCRACLAALLVTCP
jgi:hypothetical protein